MPRRIPTSRLIALAATLSAPTVVVLALLVAFGGLSAWVALAGAAGAAALTALMLRPILGDAAALTAWVRSLCAGSEAAPPRILGENVLGEALQAIGQLRRLSAHKEAELAATARWHETLLDNLPDPLLLLDSSRRVVRANRAAREVFGRDLAGRDLAAALRDPAVLEAADGVLAAEGEGRQAEFTQPVPVERTFQVRVERLAPVSAEGAVAVLALHELTAIKRMERMRADFVANASHELRTPLATLLGFIETLKGPARDDSEARERFLDIMHEQASRMARLVGDLLSLSRIETNEHSAPSDAVDLGRVVTGVAKALAPLAEARGMVITVQIAEGVGPVAGQADELAQLAQNLIDNAVKYGRDKTEVSVRLAPADLLPASSSSALRAAGAISLSVEDRGEGIGREHLPRLTERFYRVDTARSRKLGGTGLGLAIVKHIVNRHRGTISVESEIGRGSVFTVILPRAAAEALPAA